MNLLWQDVQYPNNSVLNIEAIGEYEDALICQTDRSPCCRTSPDRFGEWYYPDGTIVPNSLVGGPFYRDRDDGGLVRLRRRYHHTVDPVTGLFCCVLPDANDGNHTLCIGLLLIAGSSGGTTN